jgi:hypothetical protein
MQGDPSNGADASLRYLMPVVEISPPVCVRLKDVYSNSTDSSFLVKRRVIPPLLLLTHQPA